MKSCKKSDEKYLRFGKGNSPGVFSLEEWFFASSTFLLSLLLGKLAFYLVELLRCVVIVAYLFFIYLGKKMPGLLHPARSAHPEAGSESSEGEAGIPILGLKFLEVGGFFYLLYY